MNNNHNNWALLVSTSRFWFNYRHVANVLSIYQIIKSLGIPDTQIILMLADDFSTDPRNLTPGSIFNHPDHLENIYRNAHVDYTGTLVTPQILINLLLGIPSPIPSKQLQTTIHSNILIYLTGHGGNGFLKFHDALEITDIDLARTFTQMHSQHRYNSILLIIDTCQAHSMITNITAPNIIAIASSQIGESSYSYHVDHHLGVPIIDRFTYHLYIYLKQIQPHSPHTINHLTTSWNPSFILSTPTVVSTMNIPLDSIPLINYFAHHPHIQELHASSPNHPQPHLLLLIYFLVRTAARSTMASQFILVFITGNILLRLLNIPPTF